MNHCPTAVELSDFSLGKLGERAIWAISAHLTECDACRRAIDALDEVSDKLVSAVRGHSHSWHEAIDSEAQELRELAARVERLDEPNRDLLEIQSAEPFGDSSHVSSLSLADTEGASTLLGKGSPPRRLGQYLLLEKIGQGAMGAVYRARHERLKRIVAVKVLPAGRVHDERAIARFKREMEAVGQLDHVHIVRATDAGEAEGLHFLVMEFVDGLDLHSLAIACGKLPIAEACELVRQAAIGLHHAHERGLVHRDVKPSNLILDVLGNVKVLDLGLALLAESLEIEAASEDAHLAGIIADTGDAAGSTSPSQILGTREYMAPEQAACSRAVDGRGDIYSLGCTLFRLLTGGPPFPRENYESLFAHLRAIASEPAPFLDSQRPDAPPMLSAIVARMLAKRPEDRFASAAEAAAALAPYGAGADLAWLIACARNEISPGDRLAAERATIPALTAPQKPIDAELATSPRHAPPKDEVYLAELSDSGLSRVFPRSATSWKLPALIATVLAVIAFVILVAPLAYYSFRREAPVSKAIASGEKKAAGRTVNVATSTAPSYCLSFSGNAHVVIENSGDFLNPRGQPFTAEVIFRSRGAGGGSFGGEAVIGFRADPPVERDTFPGIGGRGIGIPRAPRGLSGPFGEAAHDWALMLTRPIGAFDGDSLHFEFHEGDRFGISGGPPSRSRGGLMGQANVAAHPGWHHVALCSEGGQLFIAVDGLIQTADMHSLRHAPPWESQPTGGSLLLGSSGRDLHSSSLAGDIRTFRVSKTCRYREKYAPPASLSLDEETICFFDFSEGTGEELADKSGGGRNGKIVGAVWSEIVD